MAILNIDKKWLIILEKINITSAELLSDSDNQRVYYFQDIIYKIRLKNTKNEQTNCRQTLQREMEFLHVCSSISGIPKIKNYKNFNSFEVLAIHFLKGQTLNDIQVNLYLSFIILFRLSVILFYLSAQGISHNDILPKNIILTDNSVCYLIDFDQASISNRFQALLRNFFVRANSDYKVYGSFITIVKHITFQLFRRNKE